MTARVVVVGSVNIDETLPVEAWPRPGETTFLAAPARTGLGGKGANQAIAAALAGADVVFVGAVGADEGGDAARSALVAAGAGDEHLRSTPGLRTGRATILLHADGENSILVDPGANAAVDLAHVAAAGGAIADAAVVLAQGELAPTVIDAVAAECVRVGTRFVLNLAPVVVVAQETLDAADPLVVNEGEARALGIDPDAPSAARPRSLVITRGAAGARVIDAAGVRDVPAPTVVAVDTTGAGDAFVGTLCAALATGASLADAARAGADAGAFAVTRAGASASYGTPAEVRSLVGAHVTP